MEQTTEATAALLPGIVDLAPRIRRHMARAYVAEQVGNHLLASFELHQAVAAAELETDDLTNIPSGRYAEQARAPSRDLQPALPLAAMEE